MSLIEELTQNGLSAEDLEKAASVRLFEKAAADEGIDFNTMNDEQINDLFAQFVNSLQNGEEEPKQANAPVDLEKAASVFLFQKIAADEELDLQSMDPEQVEDLYTHFLENVLPQMYEDDETKQANAEQVEEAQAKLAEVDILGRHMARAFHDESTKIAGRAGDLASAVGQRGKALISGSEFRKRTSEGLTAAARSAGPNAAEARKILAARGAAGAAAVGTAAAGAYGAKNMYDRRKSTDKAASVELFDKLAEERAVEMIEASQAEETEPSFDDLLNARAIEMLEANGYTFEE